MELNYQEIFRNRRYRKYVIQPLINIPYSKESIYERFKHIDVEKHILNLTNEEFIKLLI